MSLVADSSVEQNGKRAKLCTKACPNGCKLGASCTVEWRQVPRLNAAPDIDTYLSEFAIPRQPFIVCLDAVKSWGWPAAVKGLWEDVRYIEQHPQLVSMERLFDSPEGFRPIAVRARPIGQADAPGVSCPMTPQEALQKLRRRMELQKHGGDGVAMYVGAWEYDADDWQAGAEPEHPPAALNDDLAPGVPFVDCVARRTLGQDHRLLRCLRWLYIGEPGSGTSAHTDPIATHGWMWQAKGKKRWRLASWAGMDSTRPQGSTWEATPGLLSVPRGAPADLFGQAACKELLAWDGFAGQAWACELEQGEVIFIPSAMLHAVQNIGDSLSIAVSHNWVDSSNALAVLQCLEGVLQYLQQATSADGSQDLPVLPSAASFEDMEATLGPQAKELVLAAMNNPTFVQALCLHTGEGSKQRHDGLKRALAAIAACDVPGDGIPTKQRIPA